jgi:uncharacterized surface protein with fasciclin (FAS1) repeats
MRKEMLLLFICFCLAGVLIAGCTTPTTTPPATTQVTTVATPVQTTIAAQTTTPPMKTIVSTAVENGNFTTLVTALKAANLDSALSGKGPFTVFAPSDAAFKKLPNGTVEKLLLDPKGQLTDVLTYHVVSGMYVADDVVKMKTIKTLEGQNLTVNVTKEGVFINNARIVTTDIKTDNGVIHVIDAVLIPPAPAVNKTANTSAVKTNGTMKSGT